MEITLPNEWIPRPYQKPLWGELELGKKRVVAVWHRRAGKDSLALNWTAVQAFQRVGTYWHMLPTQRQARKVVWDGVDGQGRKVIDQVWPKALRKAENSVDMKIELINGSVWQCVGSDAYDSLVGSNPVGVIFSEFAIADPSAWDYIRPILAENGGWALFIYTPRGGNHGKDLFDMAASDPNWYAEVLNVDDTGSISSTAVDDERKAGMDENIIQQEFYCSFLGVVDGSYYGREMQDARSSGRVGRVPWEPSLPVNTAWDLGMSDDMPIWFYQQVGLEVRIIDYYVNRGMGLDHYAKILREEPYTYGEHNVPHDAAVRELGTGVSRVATLRKLGISVRVLEKASLADGINATRVLIPKCWFDLEKCKDGIKALELYKRNYDEKRKVFSEAPLHDWASHPADAFRYLAQGIRPVNHAVPMNSTSTYDEFEEW